MKAPLLLILSRLGLGYLGWSFFEFLHRMPSRNQIGDFLFAGCGTLCVITLIVSCFRRPWVLKLFLGLLLLCSLLMGFCFEFFLQKPDDGWAWLTHSIHLPALLGVAGPLVFVRILYADPQMKAYFQPAAD